MARYTIRAIIMTAIVAVIVVDFSTVDAGKAHELATSSRKFRFRRNVRDLYDMLTASKFKNIKIAETFGYGRFCGMGNAASQLGLEAEHALEPLDAIDGCCKLHDRCYDNSSLVGGACRPPIATQLSPLMRYLTPYYMEKISVKKGRSMNTATLMNPGEELGKGEFLRCKGYDWTFIDPTLPLGWINTCGVTLCGCDYAFAKCLKQNEGTFNRTYLSTRSLVDQASDQFGPVARHSLQILRTGATINKVQSDVMEIFDFMSSWAPKTSAAAASATDEEAKQRSLELAEHHETAAAPWMLWG